MKLKGTWPVCPGSPELGGGASISGDSGSLSEECLGVSESVFSLVENLLSLVLRKPGGHEPVVSTERTCQGLRVDNVA